MDEADEILELFDIKENLIGTIHRGDTKTLLPNGGHYIRAANAFLQRKNGDIWVPKRSIYKSIAPGGLDYSTGGHLAPGEDYIACLVREFEEEAGIHIAPTDLQLIHISKPSDDNSTYFSRLYLLSSDEPPMISGEHVSGEWLQVDELIDRLEQGTVAKKSLLSDAKMLAEYFATQH